MRVTLQVGHNKFRLGGRRTAHRKIHNSLIVKLILRSSFKFSALYSCQISEDKLRQLRSEILVVDGKTCVRLARR
jgi:hypothetical protein